MKHVAWVGGDLSSARRRAATFLDNFAVQGNYGAAALQNWIARWTKIGDDQSILGDLNINKGAFEQATEAWLCALTAFEIARRLVEGDDAQCEEVSAKVETGIKRFELPLAKIERVKIAGFDHTERLAYYLPAGSPNLPAPAVICISMEEETAATLLGRLLPVVTGRGISVLVISHDVVSSQLRRHSEALLSCCLDYLSIRPNVDASRVGVYGEGLSAVLATKFAASDHRVAAAVCDGGLWHWSRTLASLGWMMGAGGRMDEGVASRSQVVRHLRCPILVVAGGRGLVSVSEAISLLADCVEARIDLQLAVPRMIRSSTGEVENFVTSDECIFGWLEHRLSHGSAP